MLLAWLHTLPESQPQLCREVQMRWRRVNVLLVTALSLVCQYALVQMAFASISVYVSPIHLDHRFSPILLQRVYQNLFNQLMMIDVGLLLFLGSYFLRKSWLQEAKTGTLTFLRLSPQPAEKILWGKLIGAPILLYWAIALALPLHIWAAYQSGMPIAVTLLVVLLPLSMIGMAYILAIASVLKYGAKSALIGLVMGNLGFYLFWNLCHWWIFSLEFYLRDGLPMNFSWIVMATGMTLFWCICLPSAWRECVYRFHHPDAPAVLHLHR
jgi:hypothetical protein